MDPAPVTGRTPVTGGLPGRALPLRGQRGGRRFRGRGPVLRAVRLPGHHDPARGARRDRSAGPGALLRPPHPPAAPRRRGRHRRRLRGVGGLPLGRTPGAARRRRPVGAAVRRELALPGPEQRLLRLHRGRRQPLPALLVAGDRGTVLRALPGPAPGPDAAAATVAARHGDGAGRPPGRVPRRPGVVVPGGREPRLLRHRDPLLPAAGGGPPGSVPAPHTARRRRAAPPEGPAAGSRRGRRAEPDRHAPGRHAAAGRVPGVPRDRGALLRRTSRRDLGAGRDPRRGPGPRPADARPPGQDLLRHLPLALAGGRPARGGRVHVPRRDGRDGHQPQHGPGRRVLPDPRTPDPVPPPGPAVASAGARRRTGGESQHRRARGSHPAEPRGDSGPARGT